MPKPAGDECRMDVAEPFRPAGNRGAELVSGQAPSEEVTPWHERLPSS